MTVSNDMPAERVRCEQSLEGTWDLLSCLSAAHSSFFGHAGLREEW